MPWTLCDAIPLRSDKWLVPNRWALCSETTPASWAAGRDIVPTSDAMASFAVIEDEFLIQLPCPHSPSFSNFENSTRNLDMQELDYNPSKKDLTDARIHHLLAEELKPYRRVSPMRLEKIPGYLLPVDSIAAYVQQHESRARTKSPFMFKLNWNSLMIWYLFYFFPITQFLFINTNAFLPLKISWSHSIHQGLIVSGMIKIYYDSFYCSLDYKQIITLTMISIG